MGMLQPTRRLTARGLDPLGPRLAAGVAGLVLLAAFLAAASSLPRPLVLPILSLAALGIAAAVALFAWRRPIQRDAEHVTYWDVAGALTFLGVSAATLSEPEHFWPLIEQTRYER